MIKLIDSHKRWHNYLRISVTDRCNFRCRYCLPSESVEWKKKENILSFDEIFRLANIMADSGIYKIRLTGGEPLVRKDIEVLISQLTKIENIQTLGLTTNGYFLREKIHQLREAGLQNINISLDTLNEQKFKEITRRNGFDNVVRGIYEAIDLGFNPIKLNVVIIKGFNEDEINDFVEFVKDKPITVRFIEYMPFIENFWIENGFISCDEIKSVISNKYDLTPLEGNGVSRDYSLDDFSGCIGFISPMSNHFCGSCNRLRLTSDGYLKSCLFSDGEINLKKPLRSGVSDEELKNLIRQTVKEKKYIRDGISDLTFYNNRRMAQIGG